MQSVIIRVITKSDDRAAGVQFVYHEYDYRLYHMQGKITECWLAETEGRVKTVRVETAGVERSTRQNFVAAKLKVNFFVLLRVALLVLQA